MKQAKAPEKCHASYPELVLCCNVDIPTLEVRRSDKPSPERDSQNSMPLSPASQRKKLAESKRQGR
jgi:hypothetical protein